MKADKFLEHLRDAMPDRDTLEEFGLEDDEIAEIQSTFIADSRPTSTETLPNEGVLRLISEFDCSNIEIGLVRFEGQPKQHGNGVAFAVCEADTIVLREDGTIAMYDHASPESTPIECASDSEHFLDGLAAFVSVRKDRSQWTGQGEEAAETCANAAGGLQYLAFFRSLCGFIQ